MGGVQGGSGGRAVLDGKSDGCERSDRINKDQECHSLQDAKGGLQRGRGGKSLVVARREEDDLIGVLIDIARCMKCEGELNTKGDICFECRAEKAEWLVDESRGH